jgi:hypothetical protein
MIQQRNQSNTTMLPIATLASVAIVSTTTPSTGHNKEEGDDFFKSRFKNSNPSHDLLKIPHGDPTFSNVVGIGGVGRRDAPAESEAVRFDGRVALAKSEEITSAKEEKKPSFFSPIFRIVAGAARGLGSGRVETVVTPLGGIRTDPARDDAATPVVSSNDKQQEKQKPLFFLSPKPMIPFTFIVDGENDFNNSKLSNFSGDATTDEVAATKAMPMKQCGKRREKGTIVPKQDDPSHRGEVRQHPAAAEAAPKRRGTGRLKTGNESVLGRGVGLSIHSRGGTLIHATDALGVDDPTVPNVSFAASAMALEDLASEDLASEDPAAASLRTIEFAAAVTELNIARPCHGSDTVCTACASRLDQPVHVEVGTCKGQDQGPNTRTLAFSTP